VVAPEAAPPVKQKRKIKIQGAPVAATEPAPAVAPKPKKKVNIKPAVAQSTAIAQVTPGFPLIATETVTIKVSPITIDGRSLYYNSNKGKVYDLKFKYLGRLKGEKIVAFPDSDAEI
jgi:hypothetical protein